MNKLNFKTKKKYHKKISYLFALILFVSSLWTSCKKEEKKINYAQEILGNWSYILSSEIFEENDTKKRTVKSSTPKTDWILSFGENGKAIDKGVLFSYTLSNNQLTFFKEGSSEKFIFTIVKLDAHNLIIEMLGDENIIDGKEGRVFHQNVYTR